MKTLAFTGSRPAKLGGYDENNPTARLVKDKLKELIQQAYVAGYRTFITGMALGVDQWAAEVVCSLKNNQKDIKLIAALPFISQSSVWNFESQKRWKCILSQCDEIYIVDSDNLIEYQELVNSISVNSKNGDSTFLITKKLDDRNKWMVNQADCILAIWNQMPGGTANCVQYARKRNKKIICFNPNDNIVSQL